MKRLLFLTLTTLLLAGCCSYSDLDKAIIDGYTNADNAAGGTGLLTLSDQDYTAILQLFLDEPNSWCGDDSTQSRWEHIKDIVANETALDTARINKEQWLGVADQRETVIDVYFDNTQSMKGYIGKACAENPVFVNTFLSIDDYCFAHKISADAITSFYTQRNKDTRKDELVAKPWKEMKDELTNYNVREFTDSYRLGDFLRGMVDSIVADNNRRHLTLFITDGIPSGPSELVTGTEYSKLHVVDLKNEIRDAAARLKDQGGAASLYQFEGPFSDGIYYYYDNSRKIIGNTPERRPFYVLVVGESALVTQFKNDVEAGMEHFRPERQIHFFAADQELSPRVVCPSGGSEIDANKVGQQYEIPNPNGDENVNEVKVLIPFEQLPFLVRDSTTLQKAVTVTFNNQEKTFTTEDGNLKMEHLSVGKDSHLIVEVYNETPAWVEAMTTHDDKADYHGTFNLDVLVNGLKEGLMGNQKTLIKKEFTLDFDNE